jgi:hypothetical protein
MRSGPALPHRSRIAQRIVRADSACRPERVAGGACVDVAGVVVDEFLSTERAVLLLRLIDDANERRDLHFLNKPREIGFLTP